MFYGYFKIKPQLCIEQYPKEKIDAAVNITDNQVNFDPSGLSVERG
jgi:hypothetical protein